MAGSVGTAYLTLVPKCDTALLGKEGENAGNVFGAGFTSKISTAAKVGAAAMAATVAGIAVASKALKDAISATAEYGDTVDKMSQKLGLSTSAYQKWDYVMNLAGTDMQSMTTGLKTLTNKFDDARNGSKSAIETFEKLGISMEQAASMSREDLFAAAIKGMQGMEDSTERAALANDLFGKSGQNLAPLFNQTAEETQRLMEQAEKYGLVMSESAVKASAEFKDSLTTLNGAISGAKNALMGELLPSATQVADGLTLLITGNVDEGIELISSGISTMLEKITSNFPAFLENGSKIVMEMLNGLNKAMPSIVAGLVNLLVTLISQIPTYIPVIFSAAVQLFMGIVQAAPTVVGALLGAIGQLIMNGVNAVRSYVGSFMSAGGDLIRGMVAGLDPGAVLNKIRSICASAVDAIKSFFGIHSPSRVMRELFGYVGDGMVLGLEDSQKDVDRAMNKLMDSTYAVADGFTSNLTLGSNVGGSYNFNGITINAQDRPMEQVMDELIRYANRSRVMMGVR